MVLLENHDDALPMPTTGNVAVFGVGAYKTVKGGTGSGDVNNRYTITRPAGPGERRLHGHDQRRVLGRDDQRRTTRSTRRRRQPLRPADRLLVGRAAAHARRPCSRPRRPTPRSTSSPATPARAPTARPAPATTSSRDTERDDITLIGQTYQHVVVVLNVGGIVDTSFYKQINAAANDPTGGQALDSLLLMSQAGQESGNALVDVLDGKVDAVGQAHRHVGVEVPLLPGVGDLRRTTTATRHRAVQRGHLRRLPLLRLVLQDDRPGRPGERGRTTRSATGCPTPTFAIKTAVGARRRRSTVTVKAKVTNTGTQYSGKEVVQVYFSAPQTGLDKPYQELAGYAKTDELAPGASQTVTITLRHDATCRPTTRRRRPTCMDAGDYVDPRRRLVAQHPRRREARGCAHDVTHRAASPRAERPDARPPS